MFAVCCLEQVTVSHPFNPDVTGAGPLHISIYMSHYPIDYIDKRLDQLAS